MSTLDRTTRAPAQPALATGRLGVHHFAYLRALCEGLGAEAAAARYLHVDHARAARSAHKALVERARALARRLGNPAWRLIGIEVRAPSSVPATAHGQDGSNTTGGQLPSLVAWAEAHGLDGLREGELQDLYAEAFGLVGSEVAVGGSAEPRGLRRQHQRAERLRRRQFDVLRALEAAVAQPARPDDPVDGWLPPAVAGQLVAAGIGTLGELTRCIERGGRWWRGLLHACGPTKAARLARHVALLLGDPPCEDAQTTSLGANVAVAQRPAIGPAGILSADDAEAAAESAAWPGQAPTSAMAWLLQPAATGLPSPAAPRDRATLAHVARLLFDPTAPGAADLPAWVLGRREPRDAPSPDSADGGRPGPVSRLAATDDRAAVREWISARAGSQPTAIRYQREVERWMLWLITRRGRALSAATALDCRAYMDFLADLPDDWISRRQVVRWAPGWAPFRGSLTRASQAYAVHVLHGLYEWLVRAGHLGGNPWTLVNRKAPDAAQPRQAALGPASRAFTPQAWAALHAHLQARPPGPSTARLRWLCTFAEATGLRAAELLAARLGDLQDTGKGWLIVVVGKGGKGRVVPVPQVALQATREYLASRGLALGDAPPQTPLLSALQAPLTGITYSALYETFTRFVRQALASSALTQAERDAAAGAALHWLRHTHATRAAERGVPPDVVQAGLGHADPRITAAYYRAQIERRQREMEKAFGPPNVA